MTYRFGKIGLISMSLLAMAATVYGQTAPAAQDAAPAPSAGASSSSASALPTVTDSAPPQTVTVFGHKVAGDRGITQIDTHQADSCGFMNNYDPANEDIVQDYLKSFYGNYSSDVAYPDQTNAGANDPGVRFRDTSPYGDVSQDNAANSNTMYGLQIGSDGQPITGDDSDADGGGGNGACDPSDKAFAAGRSYIARNDHSLNDAFNAFDAKDYPKALDLFHKSYAKMGYDSAALMEGKMYLAGMGTKPDAKQAILWLRKVVEGRFGPDDEMHFNPDDPTYMNTRVDAAMTLAKIYMTGLGVPRDAAEARRWYIKADEFGYMPATHTVGEIYQYGYAGEKNVPKAVTYYKKAGTAGYAPSMYALGELYLAGDDGVTQDRKAGAQWLMAAAKRGHAGALYAIGNMYDLGDILPHDAQKAATYYKEAALKGQPDAEDAIGLMFYTGEVVGQDLPLARKWFTLAARQQNADAMFNLGAMLANGQGGDKDMALAFVWLTLAKEGGSDKAAPALAVIAPKMTADDRAKADAILNPKG
ncbi:tetratricopeptide repeat protein [Asticcacaulis sp. EMRT-3]|uniref:tetratricopeptide repeat protein n=1 Tax=Asticcacaulis sp. EMRT-3 TaxID=3040349 RepID=UPI0024AF431A|nr:tetratricopeptide repeat protein [Asticcacaulis sp. EMRT-3]MDI7776400.1 tetratricopeptide repeat protein [Asticcacaulis sp. EMRT-3]